ncbi:uncharacterized protein LOC101862793 isoform X3 [Aplysia californica]|uniref:Uncharacterized protein LOC101862793 isoform X3 n=1 Tax=Aplysia californica TaxID=6500 RepID=A0ABM0JMV1_APLCA|nr:uncharacterized protein LOC101862793 isoform X3 [Aplysia californica]
MAAPPERAGVVRDEATDIISSRDLEEAESDSATDVKMESQEAETSHCYGDEVSPLPKALENHTQAKALENNTQAKALENNTQATTNTVQERSELDGSSSKEKSMNSSKDYEENSPVSKLEHNIVHTDEADSLKISDPPVPIKRRGRPRKGMPVKRKIIKSLPQSHPKKKRKRETFPIRLDLKHRGPEREVLESLDALSLAVEMGYANPHEQTGDVSEKDSTQEQRSGQDGEVVVKKISAVENIQQVIDYKKTCSCVCLMPLQVRDIASHRLKISVLDRQQRDFFIMGLFCSSAIPSSNSRVVDRQVHRYNYRFLNSRVCQPCFLFVNNIGDNYMKAIKKHYIAYGVKSRTHGNIGRKPRTALASREDDVSDVVDFVTKYAMLQGIPAPRPPKNSKSKRVIRLPPTDTFASVYKQYKELCSDSGKKQLGLTSFKKIWHEKVGHVKVASNYSKGSGKETTPTATVFPPPPQVTTQSSSKDMMAMPIPSQDKVEHKRYMKGKTKMTMSKYASPHPQSYGDIPQQTPQMNLPFELSSGAEMPQAPVVSFCMYLNENPVSSSESSSSSWQHDLLMPHHSHHHSHSMSHSHAHIPQGSAPHPNASVNVSRASETSRQVASTLPSTSSEGLGSGFMHNAPVGIPSAPRPSLGLSGQTFLPLQSSGLPGHQW